jgi:hypothetical protein
MGAAPAARPAPEQLPEGDGVAVVVYDGARWCVDRYRAPGVDFRLAVDAGGASERAGAERLGLPLFAWCCTFLAQLGFAKEQSAFCEQTARLVDRMPSLWLALWMVSAAVVAGLPPVFADVQQAYYDAMMDAIRADASSPGGCSGKRRSQHCSSHVV